MVIDGYETELVKGRYCAVWKEPVSKPVRRTSTSSFAWLTFGLLAYYAGATGLLFALRGLGPDVIAVLFMLLFHLPVFWGIWWKLRERKREAANLGLPLPVTVSFEVVGKGGLGSDHGFLDLQGEWLSFEGDNTRFRLRSSDLENVDSYPPGCTSFEWLKLKTMVPDLPLVVLLRYGPREKRLEPQLIQQVLTEPWSRWEAAQPSEAASVFPPVRMLQSPMRLATLLSGCLPSLVFLGVIYYGVLYVASLFLPPELHSTLWLASWQGPAYAATCGLIIGVGAVMLRRERLRLARLIEERLPS